MSVMDTLRKAGYLKVGLVGMGRRRQAAAATIKGAQAPFY